MVVVRENGGGDVNICVENGLNVHPSLEVTRAIPIIHASER